MGNNVLLTEVKQHKHLCLILTSNLSWENHTYHAINKANKVIGNMWQLNKHIPRISLLSNMDQPFMTIVMPLSHRNSNKLREELH
jgi:hypothetical protein